MRDLDHALRRLSRDARVGGATSREDVASLSGGSSGDAIYRAVSSVLAEGERTYANVVDVGCGQGGLGQFLRPKLVHYTGCDIVRYSGFPQEEWADFIQVDLNDRLPLPDATADLVLSVEVIEHLENPRALVRELTRICRPGGRIVVTTPNQLSLMSKLSLLTKDEFVAFQEAPGLYPTHITALVEADLRHIAEECGLTEIKVCFTDEGRIPLTSKLWPKRLGFRGRWFSDNVVLTARRPSLEGGLPVGGSVVTSR